ncbi:hypothetical protein [Methanoculleus horonobensis]|uniref:hypothetical protein n=1 Tax=Methanoculleus horonobensis TaxID=528314 RepID=UPI0008295871|nr:hypothetical protein [Methanoculleus horonobensis]
MSLDFLTGFTIFMLSLIMVVSMVPGLLAGLQSSGIDYDAVAYRTGVILAEDPGWPVYPPWEMKTEAYKDEINRMGLAVSKETPNILLSTKVNAFFNSFFTEDDYRGKAIFGDIPYSYNFSLRSADGTYNNTTGGTPPSGHGYIRRAVKIKEPSTAVINGSFAPQYTSSTSNQEFIVRLNFSQLLDPSVDPAYRVDPRTEPVNITITDFDDYLNVTHSATSATLKNVTFWKMDPTAPMPRFTRIPFSYNTEDPDLYTLFLDGGPDDLEPGAEVSNNISLVLKPAATSIFTLDQNSILDIRFNFENNPPQTHITGIHHYDYNQTNVTRFDLKPAVLEVAIW